MLKQLRNSLLIASTTASTLIPTAHAANVDTTGKDVINSILDIIYTMALYIGIILLVWSIVMLVLALKNEDADSKSRAIMLIAVSIALIGIGTVVQPIVDGLM